MGNAMKDITKNDLRKEGGWTILSLLRTRLVHEKSMKNQLVVYPEFYDKFLLIQTPDFKRIRLHQILVHPIKFKYFFRQLNWELSLSYCLIKTCIPNKEKKIVVLITLWEYIKNTFDHNEKYLNVFSFLNELT